MANDYFQFKRFTVRQSRSAMKVGTDGTLLGAWARGGQRILDIGTGTGLIALMMAQRYPSAYVVGVEIDDESCGQASENVSSSEFSDRISVVCCDIRQIRLEPFDAIVCNPPFFVDSLECPDSHRTQARHASSLSYKELFSAVSVMLVADGVFSAVIPSQCKRAFESEAYLAGFFMHRECAVKTTALKPAKRYLLEFGRKSAPLEATEGVIGSEWYDCLTKDFYL